MKTEPAMPLFIGDYLQDTMGLTRSEHGSYMLLIMAYWTKGGPLDNDDRCLREIARCPDAEWVRTKGIMERFFEVNNGCWKHKRIDSELQKCRERTRMLAEASAKGVQARRDLGQIPPVQPIVQSSVSPSVQSINARAELERVEARINEIRQQGTLVAGSPMTYTVRQRTELTALKDRKEQLKSTLGFKA